MQKKKHVLISGWFGNENLGDELILKSIIHQIKTVDKNIIINVMASKPKSVSKYHKGISTVSTYIDLRFKSIIRLFKYNPIKLLTNIITSDYLILASGGALSDWNPESTYMLFFMIDLFKNKLKRPVIMLGVGAGPIASEASKVEFKQKLDDVDIITVRDMESFDLLKSIGLSKVYLTNDVVFDLKDNFQKRTCKNKTNKNLGIIITPLFINNKYKHEKYKKTIIKYIENMKSKKYNITLIPFQYNYDIKFLTEINKQVNVNIYENGKVNMWGIIDELKKQDLIIGMRFHSVVASLLLNIPVIPLIYHSKVYSVAKTFKLLDVAQGIGDGQNWNDVDIDLVKLEKDSEYYFSILKNEKSRLQEMLRYKVNDKNLQYLKKFFNMKGNKI